MGSTHDVAAEAPSKVVYSATMSLDGFIAGPGGDMSWLTDLISSSSPDADDLVNGVGALLVGKTTFTGDDPNAGTDSEGAFGGAWQGPTIVLTHHPVDSDDPDVTFMTDLGPAVEMARQAAAGKYVHVLGANVARQCIELGLLDEVLVLIVPVFLGDGVRLFDVPGGRLTRLDPIEPDRTGPLTHWYRVVR